jgi:hypothetical protein
MLWSKNHDAADDLRSCLPVGSARTSKIINKRRPRTPHVVLRPLPVACTLRSSADLSWSTCAGVGVDRVIRKADDCSFLLRILLSLAASFSYLDDNPSHGLLTITRLSQAHVQDIILSKRQIGVLSLVGSTRHREEADEARAESYQTPSHSRARLPAGLPAQLHRVHTRQIWVCTVGTCCNTHSIKNRARPTSAPSFLALFSSSRAPGHVL